MTQSALTVLHLLLREEWRGGPGALGADMRLPEGVPVEEAALVKAAAALGAGEPKRAVRILDANPNLTGDLGAVACVLRIVADTLERNWFPGGAGAVFDPGDIDQLRADPVAPASPGATLLVVVANRLVAALPNWCSIATGTRRGAQFASADAMLPAAEQLVRELSQAGAAIAVAPTALALADLEVRAGCHLRAGDPLGLALQTYQAVRDPVGVAACALAQGDWAAEPDSHPELLGEDLEGPVQQGPVVVEPDWEFAAERYGEAERRFVAVGATRGVAAIALRRARTAGGRAPVARRRRGRGGGAGRGSGQRRRGLGNDGGGRSYARGLAWLCHAKARRWRDRDVLRARKALLIAEAINDRIGAVTEPALVRTEVAAQYGVANYRRVALVLTLLDLAETEQSPARSRDELAWAQLVELAMSAHRDANALRDAEGLARTREHLCRIAALNPEAGSGEPSPFRMFVEHTVAEAGVLIPLYQGVDARARGDLEGADGLFQTALAAAEALGPAAGMLPAIVLGTMRRTVDALVILQPLTMTGQLPLDLAASFFVRLERFDLALAAIDQMAQLGESPRGWRPWEWPALHAEALVGVGRMSVAVPIAERAIERFEHHLAGLSRDVLRTMATDDFTVAGLYTTAVRAHADLHAQSDTNESEYLATAFELSDRCRGMSLSDLIDLDCGAGSTPAVAAVQAWQHGGAELARTIEGLSTDVAAATGAPPHRVRRTVRAAERQLDDAEARLAAVAPTLLERHRRLPDTLKLTAVQERLVAGTLLLQYHAFNDELIGWAVTRDSARLSRRSSVTPMLTAQIRQLLRSLANPASTAADRDALGRPLGAQLLSPFADEIGARRRLVIVSARSAVRATLPHPPLRRRGSRGHACGVLPARGVDRAHPGWRGPRGWRGRVRARAQGSVLRTWAGSPACPRHRRRSVGHQPPARCTATRARPGRTRRRA